MKLSREEKLEMLNKTSIPEAENARWKQIAKWNRDHARSLEDYVLIASRILQALRELSMSQRELATSLNISPQALTRIVKGRQNLTLNTIRKFEKVLGITLINVVAEDMAFHVNDTVPEPFSVHYSTKATNVFKGKVEGTQVGSSLDTKTQYKLKIA